jgi:putative hydrolase of the HAD superfamily
VTGAGEPRPQALLIDFGGVLTNPVYPLLIEFSRAKGLADDAVTRLITEHGPLKTEVEAYERGELSDDQFMPRFAAHLGVTVADMDEMLAGLEVDDSMFTAVGRVREHGYSTCLVSNSWGTALYPRDRLAAVFDGVVISGDVGMRKPDSDIFLHAATMVGVEPERCVFVDDSPFMFAGAEAIGMRVVHHETPHTTMQVLASLFDIDFRDLVAGE